MSAVIERSTTMSPLKIYKFPHCNAGLLIFLCTYGGDMAVGRSWQIAPFLRRSKKFPRTCVTLITLPDSSRSRRASDSDSQLRCAFQNGVVMKANAPVASASRRRLWLASLCQGLAGAATA